MAAGDVVFLYTDGITEAQNRRGEMFGVVRLEAALRKAAGLPANAIIERVFAEVEGFATGVPQADDMTAIALKIEEFPGR